MTQVTQHLDKLVANTYGLAVKTLNYHWNVTGPNFKTVHEMLGEQYNEMILAIDELAERMRMLHVKVEATFEHFSKNNSIGNGNKELNCSEMLKDLANGHQQLIKMLKEGIEIAEKNNDDATADILTTRIEAHDKYAWMILASV